MFIIDFYSPYRVVITWSFWLCTLTVKAGKFRKTWISFVISSALKPMMFRGIFSYHLNTKFQKQVTAITIGTFIALYLLTCTAVKRIWTISGTSHKSSPKPVSSSLLWFHTGPVWDTHTNCAAKTSAKGYRNPTSYAQCHSFERIWALTWGAN